MTEKEIRVEATVKNNVLWHAIYDGWPTMAAFCREYGLEYMKVCALLNLSAMPFLKRGGYRVLCLRLAEALGTTAEELFPPQLYVMARTSAVFEMPLRMLPIGREALRLPASTTPEDEAIEDEMRSAVSRALSKLPPRQRAVVEGYFLEEKTYTEVGSELSISRNRARELGAAGLARIRHALRRE